MGQFEPYAGVGMGVFFANLKDGASGESSSSTAVGLNTQLGLRYLVTKNVSLFGEWKSNRARFNFSDSSPTQATGGFKGDCSANIFAFGVSYHFYPRVRFYSYADLSVVQIRRWLLRSSGELATGYFFNF
jgi:opacity protein-like surface antigen